MTTQSYLDQENIFGIPGEASTAAPVFITFAEAGDKPSDRGYSRYLDDEQGIMLLEKSWQNNPVGYIPPKKVSEARQQLTQENIAAKKTYPADQDLDTTTGGSPEDLISFGTTFESKNWLEDPAVQGIRQQLISAGRTQLAEESAKARIIDLLTNQYDVDQAVLGNVLSYVLRDEAGTSTADAGEGIYANPGEASTSGTTTSVSNLEDSNWAKTAVGTTVSGGDLELMRLDPKTQYYFIAQRNVGNAVERKGVQERLSSSYSSVLGRYILQVMMGPQISENIWAEREYVEPWHKFVGRGFRESADKFYSPEVMDMSWANLVNASETAFQTKESGWVQNNKRQYWFETVAKERDYQEAAARAKAGIRGVGIYGGLREKGFQRLMKRYDYEMTFASPGEMVGLAAWLSRIEGSPWDTKVSSTKQDIPVTYNKNPITEITGKSNVTKTDPFPKPTEGLNQEQIKTRDKITKAKEEATIQGALNSAGGSDDIYEQIKSDKASADLAKEVANPNYSMGTQNLSGITGSTTINPDVAAARRLEYTPWQPPPSGPSDPLAGYPPHFGSQLAMLQHRSQLPPPIPTVIGHPDVVYRPPLPDWQGMIG